MLNVTHDAKHDAKLTHHDRDCEQRTSHFWTGCRCAVRAERHAENARVIEAWVVDCRNGVRG
jgi:hypothetical protein